MKDEHGPPTCDHSERYMNRHGREVWRVCPEIAVDHVEGWWFCPLHLPPGPKVA